MKQRLKQALSQRQKKHINEPGLVKAAVLVPLYYKEGQYYLLFIKRTDNVRVHKGQISFPGGSCEAEDMTPLDTALRESREEIGLAPSDVEILGRLDDTVTVATGYVVSPFVASIPWPYQFTADRREVEEIFEVPISALLNGNSLHEETEIVDGERVAAYSYRFQGRLIWGATARILNEFLGVFRSVGDGPELDKPAPAA